MAPADQHSVSRTRILIAEPLEFSNAALRALEAVAEVTLRSTARAKLPEALREFDVVWFRLAHRFDRPLLEQATRCRILATPVTGLDHVDLQACRELGIRVVSLRGEIAFLDQVRATAELTLALTLALMRHIPAAAAHVSAGGWDRDQFRGHELHGKTAGIVGMGRLGCIVSVYFRALGMDVVGFDPRADFPHHAARRIDSLDQLLALADVVSVHVSYEESTRHLVDRRALTAVKPGAIFVNTSRGGIVDEDALLDALRSGALAGAALDVLDGEPNITANHPLVAYAREHENLIIVPHIGGNTLESFEKTEVFLAGRVLEALGASQAVDAPAR